MAFPGRTSDALIRKTPSGGIVDVAAGTDLSPFISAANELVTELCTGSGYSTERLTIIETWLAAHFYKVWDVQTSQEIAAAVQSSFFGKVDLGLDLTFYGQQAMRLDTAGNLAVMNNAQKKYAAVPGAIKKAGQPGLFWLGTKRRPC